MKDETEHGGNKREISMVVKGIVTQGTQSVRVLDVGLTTITFFERRLERQW